MDIITLSDITISTIIGIHEWERKIPQNVIISLAFGVDTQAAIANDDITKTICYDELTTKLIEFVGNSQFQLIETLADRTAHLLQNEFTIPWLQLTLCKPAALEHAKNVSITIERGTKPS